MHYKTCIITTVNIVWPGPTAKLLSSSEKIWIWQLNLITRTLYVYSSYRKKISKLKKVAI